jgi:hypothetical protein
MRRFQSLWSGGRPPSGLRKLVATLSVLLAFISIAFIGSGGPALSSDASTHTPAPTIPLCCWPWFCPRVGYPDYAPHGVPDFDMRQDEWRVSAVSAQATQWTHSGPAAAADALWYFDSEAEFILGRKYPLVTSYGAWGDHEPRNVPPLITDLAGELQTGSQGTSLEDLIAGLQSYGAAQGLPHTLVLFSEKGPSERWMLEEAANHEVVLLLLGFWQQDGGEWVRVGGHWLAVCCVDLVDRYLDFADPLLDRAAAGYPGWSYGGLPTEPTLHNDAINVSYDRYNSAEVSVPGAQWEPAGYAGAELATVVANSLGQNFAADLEQYRGDYTEQSAVYVAADYALVIRCSGLCYEQPTPTPTPYRIHLPIVLKGVLFE